MLINEMKLGEIYSEEYLNTSNNRDLSSVMERIVAKEKTFDRDCTRWSIEEVKEFLRSLNSVSPNSISRALGFLNSFAKFICEKRNMSFNRYKLEHGSLYDLVDYDILLKTVISPKEYKEIVKQLMNVRDRVIFHLAWLGLTSDEIKNVKEGDVEFKVSNESGLEMVFVNVGDRVFKTQDPTVVENIKECIHGEQTYYIADNRVIVDKEYEGEERPPKSYTIAESVYLVKPSRVGRKGVAQVTKPTISLQHALISQNVKYMGIDTAKLHVEAIRRSKMVFVLAPENEKYFSKDYIKAVFGTDSENNIAWYKQIAKIKYATKEEERIACLLENYEMKSTVS